jgi:hypothetical protein
MIKHLDPEFESITGMALLTPERFKLPCYIQIRNQPDSKHKVACVKVRTKDGKFKLLDGHTSVVSLDGRVLVGPPLSSPVCHSLTEFLSRNRALLTQYWENSEMDTLSVLQRLL